MVVIPPNKKKKRLEILPVEGIERRIHGVGHAEGSNLVMLWSSPSHSDSSFYQTKQQHQLALKSQTSAAMMNRKLPFRNCRKLRPSLIPPVLCFIEQRGGTYHVWLPSKHTQVVWQSMYLDTTRKLNLNVDMMILLYVKFFFYSRSKLTGSDPTGEHQRPIILWGSSYVTVLLDEFQSFFKLLSGEQNQPNFAETTERRCSLDFFKWFKWFTLKRIYKTQK